MSRRRQLSAAERALWTGVTRSITPLHGPRNIAAPSVVHGETAPAQARPAAMQEPPARKQSPPLAPLDRRLKQRLARGREPIDDRIDLHGKTQKEAHAALLRFLRQAKANGAKTVLVVTGKGTGRQSGAHERDGVSERGVLKRAVPLWLSLPEFRSFVVGFEDAHVFHGGEGALYVRLRRGQRTDR
jgi:DNA-nicking Smr family endonuclease